MGRIIFMTPFSRMEITGGIKTNYQHAELLAELGFDACIYQPDGQPKWFKSSARRLVGEQLLLASDDVVVFPEVLQGVSGEFARAPSPATKVLFCQNQYYAVNALPPDASYRALGFTHFACSSTIAKGFLQRVFSLPEVSVLPCYIDRDIFFPRTKVMQIAVVPRKLPVEARFIQKLFKLKYAHLSSIPWQFIESKTEAETAETFGNSSILLALNARESFGLVPIEAMASGCIVVGFHGYGGLEYATPENGYWLSPEYMEEVADALAGVVDALERDDPSLVRMREAGAVTAARYTRSHTRDALSRFYQGVCA
jgi:glycosyltransferase involved in cell wall biosynthesis